MGLHICQTALSVFWIVSVTAILLKPVVPWLHRALSYGKLQSMTRPQFDPKLSLALPTTDTASAWRSFYALGLIVHVLLSVFRKQKLHLVVHLFLLQVCRRLLECIFVHKFSPDRRIPFVQLVAGLSFYIAAPCTIHVSTAASGIDFGFPRKDFLVS